MEITLKMAKTDYHDFREVMIDIRKTTREKINEYIFDYFNNYLPEITENANDNLRLLIKGKRLTEDIISEEDVLNGIKRVIQRNINSFVDMFSDESTAYNTSEEVEKIVIIRIEEAEYAIKVVSNYIGKETIYIINDSKRYSMIHKEYSEEALTSLEKSLEQLMKDNLTEDDIQSIENKYADLVGDILEKYGQHIVDVTVE